MENWYASYLAKRIDLVFLIVYSRQKMDMYSFLFLLWNKCMKCLNNTSRNYSRHRFDRWVAKWTNAKVQHWMSECVRSNFLLVKKEWVEITYYWQYEWMRRRRRRRKEGQRERRRINNDSSLDSIKRLEARVMCN